MSKVVNSEIYEFVSTCIVQFDDTLSLRVLLTPKPIIRISNLSKDLRFDELRKILENYGYVMTESRGGSSHYTFRRRGCQPITIPKHEPIKKVYVEMVKRVIESDENNDENIE